MNFIFSFWVSASFDYPSFSGVKKHIFFFKNIYFGTCCSVLPIMIKKQKMQLVLILPDVATHFSPEIKIANLLPGSQSETFDL